MKIMVTGHRPNKLPEFTYNYTSKKWRGTINLFKEILKKYNCTEGISGMALGTDTAFALAIIELKEEGYDIKLHCAIPCLNHSSKWPESSQKLYNLILEKADTVHIVSEEPYKPYLMQKRNEYMVDIADLCIAFWDGTSGGTKNCVEYIKKQYKPMIWIEPNKIKE
mgnify:CR=1 FL=1